MTGSSDGTVNLSPGPGQVQILFDPSKVTLTTFEYRFSNEGMTYHSRSGAARQPSPDPRCPFARVWAAARATGAEPTRDPVTYGVVRPGAWAINVAGPAGARTLEVDGQTCAVLGR